MASDDEDDVLLGLSFRETAEVITSFLEVAIHTILYTRSVYPPNLFVRRRRYDAPVYQSRHPALNEYISGAVKAVGDELLLGVIDKVVVVIKDQFDHPLERFVFAIRNMITLEPDELDDPIQNALTFEAISDYFRAFLIKLNVVDSILGEFSAADNLSFAVVLECRDGSTPSVAPEGEPVPWVPATKSHLSKAATDKAQLHAIKSVETGVIDMMLAVQESEEKLKRRLGRAKEPAVPAEAPATSKDKGKSKMK